MVKGGDVESAERWWSHKTLSRGVEDGLSIESVMGVWVYVEYVYRE